MGAKCQKFKFIFLNYLAQCCFVLNLPSPCESFLIHFSSYMLAQFAGMLTYLFNLNNRKFSKLLFQKMQKRKNGSSVGTAELDIEDCCWPEIMQTHVEHIRQMRAHLSAPVDTMGCHMLADQRAEPKTRRFQTLVALMLSSQTKDQITAEAMERLKKEGCSVESVVGIADDRLEHLLRPVGFYKRKAQYLKKVAAILKDQYDGDIPNTFDALCALPGVGPKMSNLALQIAFGKVEGIAVDTHVHRIANRLRWVNTASPEQTEQRLKELLPKSEWSGINKLLVGFGQTICLPVRPKCDECTVQTLCPWGANGTTTRKNKKKR